MKLRPEFRFKSSSSKQLSRKFVLGANSGSPSDPDEPAVKTQTITVAVKDQLSKLHGTINSFPPLVFVVKKISFFFFVATKLLFLNVVSRFVCYVIYNYV